MDEMLVKDLDKEHTKMVEQISEKILLSFSDISMEFSNVNNSGTIKSNVKAIKRAKSAIETLLNETEKLLAVLTFAGTGNRYFEVLSEYEENPARERPVLPRRQTKGSAGYDFYAINNIYIPPHGEVNVRTGIKVHLPEDEHLELHIRSSYGIKYGLIMANSVGIIDADYYNNPDNEGEILAKLINRTPENVVIHKGERFMQGIFCKHSFVDNDNATGERTGGIGSTK